MPLPVAILLPHSGFAIPPELKGRLALSEQDIFNEADVYTNLIFDFRDRATHPCVTHWLRFPYARAIIDVNRPDDLGLTRPGDGIVKHRTSYGRPVYLPGQEPDPKLERHLIRRYWRPWHQQLAALAATPQIKLVVDGHSMAAVGPTVYDDPDDIRPRAGICNLGDPTGEQEPLRNRLSLAPAATNRFAEHLGSLLADLPAFAPVGADCLVNVPYWGGWDLWAHCGKHQPWIMIELSRALHVGEQNASSSVQPPRMDAIAALRERLWVAISALLEQI